MINDDHDADSNVVTHVRWLIAELERSGANDDDAWQPIMALLNRMNAGESVPHRQLIAALRVAEGRMPPELAAAIDKLSAPSAKG
jgi:hypothetical protein